MGGVRLCYEMKSIAKTIVKLSVKQKQTKKKTDKHSTWFILTYNILQKQ